jgi:ACT domain-containing protein
MSSEIKSSARPTPKGDDQPSRPKQTVEITYETTNIEEKTDEIVDKLRKLNEKIEKLTRLDAWN